MIFLTPPCQGKQPPESPFVKGDFPVSKKPISIKNNIPVKQG